MQLESRLDHVSKGGKGNATEEARLDMEASGNKSGGVLRVEKSTWTLGEGAPRVKLEKLRKKESREELIVLDESEKESRKKDEEVITNWIQLKKRHYRKCNQVEGGRARQRMG